jgi:transposase-like protein
MERRTRRKFSADFKAKVVIEALKERITIEQLAKKHELHPNQITTWKKEFLSNAAAAFGESATEGQEKEKSEDVDKLYARIGRLEMERDWLKKKLQ